MKLIIGAGDTRLEGYIHYDSNMYAGLDIVGPLSDLPLSIPPHSCSEIIVENKIMKNLTSKQFIRMMAIIKKLSDDGCWVMMKW